LRWIEVDVVAIRDPRAGAAPMVEALAAHPEALPSGAGRPGGFGFPLRVWDEDPSAPIYLYAATIGSIDRADLTFEAAEPPFGTPISPGCCADVCLHATAAGDGGPTFIANLLIQWGHTLPVGSDPQPGVLVQVLVGERADVGGLSR
jgi:hypothetical protein